jgi:nicotinate-nucleotide adenylyltransferase
MNRTLCFGGSFNPIHHGHLICARAAAEGLGYQKVLLLPSGLPPHKLGQSDIADAASRVEMTRLAVAGDELFQVDDRETRRSGPSFTIDTVRELTAEGWGGVDWLIGADMLAMLPMWHEPMALLREARFAILARPGWTFDWPSLPAPFRELQHAVIEAPMIGISASDLRRRVAQGRSINYMTPSAVCDYISQKKLYV